MLGGVVLLPFCERADPKGRPQLSKFSEETCEQARVKDPSRRANRRFASGLGAERGRSQPRRGEPLSEGRRPESESKPKVCEQARPKPSNSLICKQARIQDPSRRANRRFASGLPRRGGLNASEAKYTTLAEQANRLATSGLSGANL